MSATGSNAHLLLDFETVYKQDPTTPNAIKIPIISSEIKSTQNLTDSEVLRNDRNPTRPGRGNIDVVGSFVVPVDTDVVGYLLKSMLNSPNTSGAGSYFHDYKTGGSQPSMVLEQGYNDIGVYQKFNGAKTSKFAIEFGGEGEQTAKFDVIGASETISASSYDDTPTVISANIFDRFQASIKEGGTSIAIVTKANLEVDLNLDTEGYAIGSNGERVKLLEGSLKINGNITAFFENSALLNKAINGTTSSLEFKLTNGSDSLTFSLPEVIYERNSPSVTGSKGILLELPYRAFYQNNADATALKVVLNNSVESY